MSIKLSKVVAVEKGIKNRATTELSSIYHKLQKQDLFSGFSKTYTPKDEEGEVFSPEFKKVQFTADECVLAVKKALVELFDITATKDFGNCKASANVVVDGVALLENVPTPYLLFLEKQLIDIKTFISKLPTLEPSEKWTTFDMNNLQWETEKYTVQRTAKVVEPIVLYGATDRHPAQTQLINKDVVVGYWDTVKFSSATTEKIKKKYLEKVDKLSDAVKQAREEANTIDVEEKLIGNTVLNFIFE